MSVLSAQRPGSGDAAVRVQRASSPAKLGPLPAALQPPPSLLTRLLACLQYGFVSVAITLFNRAVFSV